MSIEGRYAHLAGSCQACFVSGEEGEGTEESLVTCGADALVKLWEGNEEEEPKLLEYHEEAVRAVAASPRGGKFASASDDCSVKIYSYPGGEFEGNVTRFNLPVNAIEFSTDGQFLAAAGEDDHVRIVALSDYSIFRQIRTRFGPVRSLAYDPEGIYIACLGYDGTLEIWDIEENSSVFEKKKAVDPTTGHTPQCTLSWARDGSCIYVPGVTGCVWRFLRRNWQESRLCEGKHLKALTCLSVSNSGRFLATADGGGKLVCWNLTKERAISENDTGSSVSSIAWNGSDDVLAAIDMDGQYFLWKDPLSKKGKASTSEKEEGVHNKNDVSGFISDEAEDDVDGAMDDPDDFEDDSRGSLDDFIDDGEKEHVDSEPHGEKRKKRNVVSTFDPFNTYSSGSAICPKRQAGFQSGATPVESGRRFLAFNMDGCVTSRFVPESGYYSVEIVFHDTAKHPARIPMMTDYYGFTAASLGTNGVAFSSPQRSEKTNGVVMYRPFGGWSSNAEWVFHLPLGEEAVCTAIGDSWVMCATSTNLLRIFTEGGVQTSILALPGPIVSASGWEDKLFVVWHCGCPYSGPSGVEQQLEYAIYTTIDNSKIFGGRVPLSPGSELTWLGFTEAGVPAAFDSKGELLLFNSSFGGTWTPIFSATREQKSASERYWVVGITATQLQCVICKAPATCPQVMPRPVLSRVNLSTPVLSSDASTVDLERENVLHCLNLENARGPLATVLHQDSPENLRLQQATADKCKLRLFSAACSSDRLLRAYNLAESLSLQKALKGALELANRSRLYSLSSKLQVLLENKTYLEHLKQVNGKVSCTQVDNLPTDSPAMDSMEEVKTPGLKSDSQGIPNRNSSARNWDSLDRSENPFLRPKKAPRT